MNTRPVLETAGYAVDSADDGEEALEKIQVARPDLVVLDLMMPKLDGWEVLERLRGLAQPPAVVILSACPDPPRAIRAGAVGCLSKPFRFGELIETCVTALPAPR